MKITWEKVWTNGQNGSYWHYFIKEFYKQSKTEEPMQQIPDAKTIAKREFFDKKYGFSAPDLERLRVEKLKARRNPPKKITQDDIDLAMEEFKSREENGNPGT